jgi:hypothetical protein
MNNSWSCSSSNINSQWRYTNPSMEINDHSVSISLRKKFIEQMNCVRERIISVQEQRQARETIPPSIQCKSKCSVRLDYSSTEIKISKNDHINRINAI